MAINACTINAFTINSARCRRPNLFPPNPPQQILGTNNSSVSIGFAKQYPHLVRHVEHDIEDHPPLVFEQPFITVSAELLGSAGSQTIEAKQQLEFVSVIDLKVGEPIKQTAVSVNISDFKID